MIIDIYKLVSGNIYVYKYTNKFVHANNHFLMGNTNLSTTIFLLWLLMSTNLHTPIHVCILGYTSLSGSIARISYKILTETNKYSAIYKCLLSPTNLYTPIHKLCIDIYNFVVGNKWNDLQNIDKCKLILANV